MTNPDQTMVAEEPKIPVDGPAIPDDVPASETSEYTEAELARLSPEERAAITGEIDADTPDPNDAFPDSPFADAPATSARDFAPIGNNVRPQGQPLFADEPAAAPPVQQPPATPPVEPPAPAAPPALSEADIAAIVAKADEERAAVIARYDDGELSHEELSAEIRAVEERAAQARADIAWQARATADIQARFTEVATTYLVAHPELLEPDHVNGYDAEVRATFSNPAFANQPYEKVLDVARQSYAVKAAALGRPLPVIGGAQPSPGGDGLTNTTRAVAQREAPMTLAAVPPAAQSQIQGELAQLQAQIDRTTDPYELERLMKRLPDDARDQFASMGFEG